MSRRESEDVWAGALALAVVALVAVAALFLIGILAEIARVYGEHGRKGAPMARTLWSLGLALLAAWIVAAILMTMPPPLGVVGIYLAAWAFLVFVVCVESVAQRLRVHQQRDWAVLGELDTHLGPLPTVTPVSDGRYKEPVPVR